MSYSLPRHVPAKALLIGTSMALIGGCMSSNGGDLESKSNLSGSATKDLGLGDGACKSYLEDYDPDKLKTDGYTTQRANRVEHGLIINSEDADLGAANGEGEDYDICPL